MKSSRRQFGKEEERKFRFTGLDIDQKEEGIEVNQAKYCESIQEIYIPDKKKKQKRTYQKKNTMHSEEPLENSIGYKNKQDQTLVMTTNRKKSCPIL